MLSLKSVLLLNGVSSGVTGLGLVLFVQPVARLFEMTGTSPFIYTGVFLVLFAMFVIKAAMNPSGKRRSLMAITILDSAWVVGSIALLIAGGTAISTLGNVIVAAVAAWVALMIILQLKVAGKVIRVPASVSAA